MTEQQNAAPARPTRREGEPEASAEELLELLRRERANFLNYKRRVERERAEDRERARGEILLALLPVLDELERALAKRPEDLAGNPWAEGVALVHRHLMEALRSLGIERIGTEGEVFDPALHEAVHYEARPDASERRVSEVLRPGYRLGGRLLRPARVSVVGPPAEAGPERRDQGQQAVRPSAPESRVGG